MRLTGVRGRKELHAVHETTSDVRAGATVATTHSLLAAKQTATHALVSRSQKFGPSSDSIDPYRDPRSQRPADQQVRVRGLYEPWLLLVPETMRRRPRPGAESGMVSRSESRYVHTQTPHEPMIIRPDSWVLSQNADTSGPSEQEPQESEDGLVHPEQRESPRL